MSAHGPTLGFLKDSLGSLEFFRFEMPGLAEGISSKHFCHPCIIKLSDIREFFFVCHFVPLTNFEYLL